MEFSQASLCFFPFRPKYKYLAHPERVFLSQHEVSSFTPIQNKKQNYNSLFFNLIVLRKQTGWEEGGEFYRIVIGISSFYLQFYLLA
jgi:hypothetical protein